MAKVPLGLKVKDAEYPVLRVFASWPGEAKLERTIAKKQRKKVNAPNKAQSMVDNIDAGSTSACGSTSE